MKLRLFNDEFANAVTVLAFDAQDVHTFGEVADIDGLMHFTTVVFNAFGAECTTGHIHDAEVELAFEISGKVKVEETGFG